MYKQLIKEIIEINKSRRRIEKSEHLSELYKQHALDALMQELVDREAQLKVCFAKPKHERPVLSPESRVVQ